MKILVIKPSSLGDIVHALQVVAGIKQQWPQAQITWVVRDVFRGWVEPCAVVDRVILFKRNWKLRDFCSLIAQIRAERYDYVLDLQGLARSALMTAFARATHKLGRSDAREWAWLAYTQMAPYPTPGKVAHIVDILREFQPLMGLEKRVAPLAFRPSAVKKELPDNAIVLCPYSRGKGKEWPYMAELTERLLADLRRLSVVWIGQGKPLEGNPQWEAQGRFVNLINRTELEELPGIMARAKLVVAPDTGVVHLAAAMDRPLVALFGPSDRRYTGIYTCAHSISLEAPGKDLSALSVDVALEACLKLWDEVDSGRS